MINALRESPDLNMTRQQAADALERTGLPENVRGEQLSLEQFARVADALADPRL